MCHRDSPTYAHTPLGDVFIRNPGPVGRVELYLPAGGIGLSGQCGSDSIRGEVIRKVFRGEGSGYDVRLADGAGTLENLIDKQDFSQGEKIFVTLKKGVKATAFYSDQAQGVIGG